MAASMRSGLLAGFIASTMWMFFSVVFDASKTSVLVGAVVFLVGTALITTVVAARISGSAGGRA